jgi:hypothetical protein
VLHINTDAFLIHPTFSIVWIVSEVKRVSFSWRCGLVIPLVRPKLVSISEKTLAMTVMEGRKKGREGGDW